MMFEPQSNHKKILFALFLLLAVAGISYAVRSKISDEPEPVSCTLEAKLCPDGSYVGRTGPNVNSRLAPAVRQILISGRP
ncbi:MAG: hypothetical protein V1738_00195 [Patescibacteria group bacterium]